MRLCSAETENDELGCFSQVSAELAKKVTGRFGVFGSSDARFRPQTTAPIPGPGSSI